MSPIFIHKHVIKTWNSKARRFAREVAREMAIKREDERKRNLLRQAGIPEAMVTNAVLGATP